MWGPLQGGASGALGLELFPPPRLSPRTIPPPQPICSFYPSQASVPSSCLHTGPHLFPAGLD